jgi:hypothetical protein
MKSVWLTIAMTVLLVGLGAYVYFVELPSERTRTAAETQDKKLIPFEEQDITGLIVRTEVGEVVLAPDDKRAWKITAPLAADADSREVESLLRALVLGRISRVVEEQAAALGPFGLEKPATVLTIAAGSRRETLSVGDSGPISSTLYAMRASDKKVLLTSLAPKDVLNKTLLTLRKKEVLRVDQAKVDRLRLAYPANELVLYRVEHTGQPGPAAGQGKKAWKLRYPVEADADQAEVNNLLIKLDNLKALGFVDPGPQRDTLLRKLTKPDVKITVHADGTDQTVKLYQLDLTTGEAYAVTAQDAPLYRISPLAIKDLTKELFTLQDKRLLGVNMDELAMLAVKTRDVDPSERRLGAGRSAGGEAGSGSGGPLRQSRGQPAGRNPCHQTGGAAGSLRPSRADGRVHGDRQRRETAGAACARRQLQRPRLRHGAPRPPRHFSGPCRPALADPRQSGPQGQDSASQRPASRARPQVIAPPGWTFHSPFNIVASTPP